MIGPIIGFVAVCVAGYTLVFWLAQTMRNFVILFVFALVALLLFSAGRSYVDQDAADLNLFGYLLAVVPLSVFGCAAAFGGLTRAARTCLSLTLRQERGDFIVTGLGYLAGALCLHQGLTGGIRLI